MCASDDEERMFSRTRSAVTGLKTSMRLCPIACPPATGIHFPSFQTSMAYFSTCCPLLSHSIVSVRSKVTGRSNFTSTIA